MDQRKENVLATLHKWISQRPGLDPRDYIRDHRDLDGIAAYRSDSRAITKDRHHAEVMLAQVSQRNISADDIIEAARRSFSGRLTIKETAEGFKIDYCTGQHWPNEYRLAVCAVLSGALWSYFRDKCGAQTGDDIRRIATQELPRAISRRWFH